jgi:hypothetical protein
MKLFTRKSKWDRIMDVAEAAMAKADMGRISKVMAKADIGRISKVTAGVVGGALAATAASAAISSIRHQDDS